MTHLNDARRRLSVLSRMKADCEIRASQDRANGYKTQEANRRKEIEAIAWAAAIAGRLVDRAAAQAAARGKGRSAN